MVPRHDNLWTGQSPEEIRGRGELPAARSLREIPADDENGRRPPRQVRRQRLGDARIDAVEMQVRDVRDRSQ